MNKLVQEKYKILATYNGTFTVLETLPASLFQDDQFMTTHNYDFLWWNWRIAFDSFEDAWQTLQQIHWLEELYSPARI